MGLHSGAVAVASGLVAAGAPPRPDEVGGATRPRNEYSDKFEKETDEAMSRIPPPGRPPKTYSKRITKQDFRSELHFLTW